jgi:acyl-CoA thioester hydrolase
MEKFDYTFRVHAGDTDYGGVMYHANYIDFFERARVEWFNHVGINLAEWARQRIFFPVATLTIDYLRPVFFNDALLIKSDIIKAGQVSIQFEQGMFKNNELVAKIAVKIACVDDTYKPVAIPSSIRETLIA